MSLRKSPILAHFTFASIVLILLLQPPHFFKQLGLANINVQRFLDEIIKNIHINEWIKPFFAIRKEKSLGLLCSKFLNFYNQDGVDSIGLDDAANRLGVERRRVYDIVNILESVGVLSRKTKNQYFWKGFSAIPRALDELKEKALRENFCTSGVFHSANVSSVNHCGGPSNSKTDRKDKPSVSNKVDNRKEISLGLLTMNFVKLFICSHLSYIYDLISLDNAATALLGDIHDPTTMRTKVRRLYDIANVSLKRLSTQRAGNWHLDDHKHTLSKKSKSESSIDCNSNEKADMPMLMKHNNSKDKHDRSSLEQQGRYSSKGSVFGPFTPASVPKVGDSGNKNERRVNLASYRPQYHNQALSDLFAHYVAAWKSWNVEVDEKKQTQQVS
ncbi:E2F transcription factor-like E2FF [Camellia sinensis]|uniref:E2F transcription factor-like E2FF n=1 Tax=Camellia sinensis TaxID=4442 RepID=UPI00103596CA|nr:E2F transcription factor-like E2FF [Camellia sinensis]